MTKNWPAYVVFDNGTMFIFDLDVPKPLFAKTIKKQIIDYGRVNVGKWICYNTHGISNESTLILRKLLKV